MMLHIVIGTKGQCVKMAPVLKELDRRGIPYNYINANQHPVLVREISQTFHLREPDVELFGFEKDISTTGQAARWIAVNSFRILAGRSAGRLRLNEDRRKGRKGLMVAHGDAPPVLLSLLLAKRFGLRFAHVEAGERTGSPFQPFPEEITRILADRFSDLLLAGSQDALDYLRRARTRGKVVDIGVNTVLDAVRFVISDNGRPSMEESDFALISIHRYETLISQERMRFVVNTIRQVSLRKKVVLVMHPSTRRALERFSFLSELQGYENVLILPLLPYNKFISLMGEAVYVVTDGGGPQQETNILGVPCMVLRESVEQTGFSNVYLTGFDELKVRRFLDDPEKYRIEGGLDRFDSFNPSKCVVDAIEDLI